MADIKALLGDKYKDGMTFEEVAQAFSDLNLVDPGTLPKSVPKETFDRTASDLARFKKELADLKGATQTDQEKLQQALEEANQTKSTYLKEMSKLRAKEVFVGAGLSATEYESLLEVVVSDNEDTTLSRAKSMVSLIDSQKKAVEKNLRATLLNETPKPPTGDPPKPGVVTKEAFAKMTYAERADLYQKDPALFKQMNE
jgi:hypothetical protein